MANNSLATFDLLLPSGVKHMNMIFVNKILYCIAGVMYAGDMVDFSSATQSQQMC